MAANNMRKKSDMYLIYYLSTAFAVTIFYVFSAIYYNPEFSKWHTGFNKMKIALVGLASIVSGIVAGSVFARYFAMILKKLMLGGAPGNDIVC